MDNGKALVRLDEQRRFTEVEVLGPEEVTMPRTPEEMLKALGRAVVAEMRAPKLTDAEQVRAWAQAFEEWLYTEPKTGDARPAATVAAYGAAWADLRAFCHKEVRFISGLDIRDWVNDLRTRPIDRSVAAGLIRNGRRQAGQMGLSASTIGQYLAGISSFFTYCQNFEVRAADGQIVILLDGPNPAKSHAVKRPRTKVMGQEVAWLNAEQLAALLKGVRSAQTLSDLERNVASCPQTIVELRDYALLLTYAMTMARNREVREWQWQQLVRRGDAMFYTWQNKGKSGSDELPALCWQAVQDYLRLDGRLEGMSGEDFIFQPSGDAILRMKRPDGSPVIDPATWTRNKPISSQTANARLRYYCRRVGIEADAVHLHSLRHSAIMLYLDSGVPIERVSHQAHHSSLDMTMRYTHRMQGQKNVDWQSAANSLGL